jgi:hypothetical protein
VDDEASHATVPELLYNVRSMFVQPSNFAQIVYLALTIAGGATREKHCICWNLRASVADNEIRMTPEPVGCRFAPIGACEDALSVARALSINDTLRPNRRWASCHHH